MVRLAEYSRDQLIALRRATGIAYDERSQGTLQLFREEKQLAGIDKDIAVLKADGVAYEVLDRAGCIAAEPGLSGSNMDIAGGLRLPGDETGDCFKFTNALADMAAAAGVEFRMGTTITAIRRSGDRITGVDTSGGPVTGDAYLVALGSHSPKLLAPLGLRVPVYPVKGYSITVPIVDEGRAPVSTLLDESYKVAITRLGDRIRVGGMAEISGFNNDLPEARRATLEYSLGSLFPGAGDIARGSYWSGLRPMTPDSTPVVGPTRFANLWLNTGHGTLGWTMACGSAAVIADLMTHGKAAIATDDLGLARY